MDLFFNRGILFWTTLIIINGIDVWNIHHVVLHPPSSWINYVFFTIRPMVAMWSAWISLGGPEFSHQNTPFYPRDKQWTFQVSQGICGWPWSYTNQAALSSIMAPDPKNAKCRMRSSPFQSHLAFPKHCEKPAHQASHILNVSLKGP